MVCSELASACYACLGCVAVRVAVPERRTVSRNRHRAAVARGGDRTAHRARDARERPHIEHHRREQTVVHETERASGSRVGPAESSAEADVPKPLQQTGNRSSWYPRWNGIGTPMFRSGRTFGLPIRPSAIAGERNCLPSIIPPVGQRRVHLGQATTGDDTIRCGHLPVEERDLALYKGSDAREVHRAERAGERQARHPRCNEVEHRVRPRLAAGAGSAPPWWGSRREGGRGAVRRC